MSQAGEETTQNINLNVSGTEKVIGATAMLQDLSGAIQQLLSNPLGGSYAMNRIAHGFETAFINPLLKTKNLTVAQRLEFDKMIAGARRVATITGAVVGLSVGMLELMRKTRIASAELTKFFNLGDLPGGAKDLYTGQLELQEQTLYRALEFNEEFAKNTEQLYKNLYKKIKIDMPDLPTEDIETIIEQISLLQAGTGVSIDPFVNLRDSLLSLDVEMSDVLYVYKLLMSEVSAEGGAFAKFDPGEAATIFLTAMNTLKGTNPLEGMLQTLTFMETYADLGPKQLPNLQAVVPAIQNQVAESITAQQLLGLQLKDLSGPEAFVNVIEALRKFTHENVTQGEPVKNIITEFMKRPRGVELLKAMNISGDLLQQINSLKKVDEISKNVSDNMEAWRVEKNVLNDTERIKTTVEKISEALENSQDIMSLLGTLFGIATVEVRKFSKELGFDMPEWIPEAALLLGAGAVFRQKYLKPRALLRNAKLKYYQQTPAGGPPGVSGEGIAPKGVKTPTPKGKGVFRKGVGRLGGGLTTIALTLGAMYADEIEGWIGTATSNVLEWAGIETVREKRAQYKPLSPQEQSRFKQLQGKYGREGSIIPDAISKEYEDLQMRSRLFAKPYANTLQGLPMGGLDDAMDWVFNKVAGKEKGPEQLLEMVSAHAPVKTEIEKKKDDKDLPNLNIIIYNADGDILASETLQDAVNQGAISIVMDGVIGVTK